MQELLFHALVFPSSSLFWFSESYILQIDTKGAMFHSIRIIV